MTDFFFSKRFSAATATLAITLIWQMATLPFAYAARGNSLLDRFVSADIAKHAEGFLRSAQADGYRVLDANGNAIATADFMDRAGSEFFLVTPESDTHGSLSYHIKIRNQSERFATIALAVTKAGDAKVLARRSVVLDYQNNDAATSRLQLAQTERSIEAQISLVLGQEHASFFYRAGQWLQGIFGIPSAHASALSTGVKVALGFAGLGAVLLTLDRFAERAGAGNSRRGPWLIGIGLVAAAVLYYFDYSEVETTVETVDP